MKHKSTELLAAALAAVLLHAAPRALPAAPATVTVDVAQPGHKVSPLLWGIFFEDINLSADGGLYAELVRNRNFQDSDKPDHWSSVGSGSAQVELTVDTALPASPKNPRALKVKIAQTGPDRAGVANGGFYGIGLRKGASYKLSLLARGEAGFTGPLTVTLESADSVPYAQATIKALTADWKQYSFTLSAKATDPKARLVIGATRPGTFFLDMVSLFPTKTWKGHGLRPDLAEMLVGLQPAFVRFPGGCWVEGDTMKESYRWKQTIGDPAERRTQHNIWAYEATHGIGYHEYLQLCEDLGSEPLFCINVGMSHRENVPMDKMGEYVQDALDAIEYANGPADSPWGSVRAKAGHPAPFGLKYLEIGNENGGPAYHERYPLFEKAIRAKYPDLHLVVNVWGGYPKESPVEIVDEHYYDTPEFFISQAGKYDTYDRSGPKVFVGEYAVTRNCGLGNLRGAIGEAAFMTGLERNSDVVVMASYAPLFCNSNHKRWPVNLINYDTARLFGLPGYYVQQLFSQHRGDVVLPVTVQAPATTEKPRSGAVGVGTWLTQAEFKDLKVTRDGQTLFASDFADGTKGWQLRGGDWKVQDGALRQDSRADNVRAFIGDKSWSHYTYSLKARKLDGAEGFLIPVLVQDLDAKGWWNIGGWGNSRHALELDGVTASEVPGRIETGRWYDIRIEVTGTGLKCYLDDKLIHDARLQSVKALHASATRDLASGEVILKIVNAAADPQPAQITLKGIAKVQGPVQALVLTSASPTDENTLDNPTKVVPVAEKLTAAGDTLSHTFPGNSLTVLRLKVQ
jgi:alpha-L-arabinofuranosidase